MTTEIKIPSLGESITEAMIAEWLVKEGDAVAKDQNLVSVDSEKATVEIPAPAAGKLTKIVKQNGDSAHPGDVIGQIETNGGPATKTETPKPQSKASETKKTSPPSQPPTETAAPDKSKPKKASPPQETKHDFRPRIISTPEASSEADESPSPLTAPGMAKEREVEVEEERIHNQLRTSGADEIKPLSPFRRTVAKRLVEAQRSMAILTTFNEVDMSAVVTLRKQFQEGFQTKYGIKLGFMSFFVKATIEALKLVPQLNAEIRGTDLVLHRRFDIGVAIGAGKGLVVPPLRDAERMSFAEIEKIIADLATRAKDNRLKPEELEGGTFTISNGGVYGSLLSTPIINPPQSGILGLHAIQDRPVAREGQVVIRPMMFVALSYDHRIVDGREAVTFLRRVKEIIEDPARLILEV
jgi:2-oxoglutarate dehydrogenase E2 component (dihydrolipoamide succinyltransferase)